jgi:hypothetical protein
MQDRIARATQEIANRKSPPDPSTLRQSSGEPSLRTGWASQDNLLAKVEAIRLKAHKDILALGFDENEAKVDVSLIGLDSMAIFHLAKELGWKATQSWYEPPAPTEGGEITIYYEPEEQVW